MSEKRASDCKCIKCGKKAYRFFGCADPDCESEPYCKECLNETKIRDKIAEYPKSKTKGAVTVSAEAKRKLLSDGICTEEDFEKYKEQGGEKG